MNVKMTLAALLMVALGLGLVIGQAGCGNGGMDSNGNGNGDLTMNLVAVAEDADEFDTLVDALEEADLDGLLKGQEPYTVFAPTDEAFERLPEGTIDELFKDENKQRLSSILAYHVVPGRLSAGEVIQAGHLQTVNGRPLTIRTIGGTVMVNDAEVIKTDIRADNGVIHVIDKVLLPQ